MPLLFATGANNLDIRAASINRLTRLDTHKVKIARLVKIVKSSEAGVALFITLDIHACLNPVIEEFKIGLPHV